MYLFICYFYLFFVVVILSLVIMYVQGGTKHLWCTGFFLVPDVCHPVVAAAAQCPRLDGAAAAADTVATALLTRP